MPQCTPATTIYARIELKANLGTTNPQIETPLQVKGLIVICLTRRVKTTKTNALIIIEKAPSVITFNGKETILSMGFKTKESAESANPEKRRDGNPPVTLTPVKICVSKNNENVSNAILLAMAFMNFMVTN